MANKNEGTGEDKFLFLFYKAIFKIYKNIKSAHNKLLEITLKYCRFLEEKNELLWECYPDNSFLQFDFWVNKVPFQERSIMMANKNWNSSYNAHDNSELRKLQLIELDIVKLFSEICTKYNLRYYLVGGTMLGAIRHKGFIPWDDDMDVGMPRPDYEKFLNIIRNELPQDYDFLNYKQNKEYKRCFSRIVNTKVKIYNASNTKTIIESAWIDIFPFDGMPSNKIRQKLHFWHMTIIRFFYHASCFDELVNLNRPGRAWYLQLAIKFISLTHIGKHMNTKKLIYKIEKNLMKYSYDKNTYMISFFGAYMLKEIVDKNILGEGKKYPFENLMLNGPVKYDEFLTYFYGDYMKPPSDENKDKHNILKIEYIN